MAENTSSCERCGADGAIPCVFFEATWDLCSRCNETVRIVRVTVIEQNKTAPVRERRYEAWVERHRVSTATRKAP